MKRGKNNKAVLIRLAIWYMQNYAAERAEGDPIKDFWLSKIKKFESYTISKLRKSYIEAFISVLEYSPVAVNAYHEEKVNESNTD